MLCVKAATCCGPSMLFRTVCFTAWPLLHGQGADGVGLLVGVLLQAKARAAGSAALAKFEEKLQAKYRQKEMRKRMIRG